MIDSVIRYDNVKFKEFYNINQDEVEHLQSLYSNLKRSITKYHNGKHEICFYLYALKEFFNKFENGVSLRCEYERTSGMTLDCDLYKFCETFFCLSKKTIQRYIRVYEKFFKGSFSDYYEIKLKEFDISKLVELLPIDDNNIIQADLATHKLNPFMTQKEIKKWVKSKRDVDVPNVDNSEEDMFEEPERYDPSKHYEKSWFNELSKGELVNYIFELQTYCEKLKEKKSKKN